MTNLPGISSPFYVLPSLCIIGGILDSSEKTWDIHMYSVKGSKIIRRTNGKLELKTHVHLSNKYIENHEKFTKNVR